METSEKVKYLHPSFRSPYFTKGVPLYINNSLFLNVEFIWDTKNIMRSNGVSSDLYNVISLSKTTDLSLDTKSRNRKIKREKHLP